MKDDDPADIPPCFVTNHVPDSLSKDEMDRLLDFHDADQIEVAFMEWRAMRWLGREGLSPDQAAVLEAVLCLRHLPSLRVH